MDISRSVHSEASSLYEAWLAGIPGVNASNRDASVDHLKERCLVAREATEKLKMRDIIADIHEHHCQIVRLSKATRTISVRVEDARRRVKEINDLLDRCAEASDALWNKNEEKEQRNARLREALRSLRMLHDRNSDNKMTEANELRPGILTGSFT